MQINENRELYDLCRKYKFYYKQHEEIKHLDKCYWSKYIREAYKESEKNLYYVTIDIIKLVLDEFIHDGGVDIETNVPIEFDAFWSGRQRLSPYRPMPEVTIKSNRLATIIQEMIKEKYHGY